MLCYCSPSNLIIVWNIFFYIKIFWDFSYGPVAKTLMQGARVWSLVRELDPTCCNKDLAQPNK